MGRRRRWIQWVAAPSVAGALAAALTGLTNGLGLFPLSVAWKVGILAFVILLTGLTTFVDRRGGGTPRGPVPAQLPPAIEHFTGREDVLRRLRRVVADRRKGKSTAPLVVSIHGPAGVGKSALATWFAHELARRYPDGRLYYDLRGGADTVDVLTGFLRALGVRVATDPSLDELQMVWRSWFHDRRVLVFLDNAPSGRQVRALIPPDPGCALIVTSRPPLFVDSTHDEHLTEFAEAEAVTLLAKLAGAQRVVDDLTGARRIVRLCDYLPLAVGICGGRLAAHPEWTLAEMGDRLRTQRLDMLEFDENAYADESVRASLWLSYDDCTEVEQRLLRALGLLRTPDVPAWAAGVLLDIDDEVAVDALDALVDAQLVETSGRDADGLRCYRLHDLVRLFASEQAEEVDRSRRRRRAAFARYFAAYRERAEAVARARWPQDWHVAPRRPNGAPDASAWLTSERRRLFACVRQAVELELWDEAWRLGRAFCSLCHSLRAFWPDWRAVAEFSCVAAQEAGDDHALAIALLERSAVVTDASGLGDARRALEIFTRHGDRWWAARAERAIGIKLRDDGDIDEAQTHLLRAIEAFGAVGDLWWQARSRRNLAEVRMAQGNLEEARRLLDGALAVFRRDANRYSEAQTRRMTGELYAEQARAAPSGPSGSEAERLFGLAALELEQAAETFRVRGEEWEQARCLRAIGEVGDPRRREEELACVRRSITVLEGLGDSWGVARSRMGEGRALAGLGRSDAAADTLRQAAAEFAALGSPWLQARCLRTLAAALIDAGRRAEAVAPAEEALRLYQGLDNVVGQDRARAVLASAGDHGAADGRRS